MYFKIGKHCELIEVFGTHIGMIKHLSAVLGRSLLVILDLGSEFYPFIKNSDIKFGFNLAVCLLCL